MTGSAELLRSFLNVYWLRPETALWRTLDLLELQRFDWTRPMLDAGCGDGIFSSMLMGARLNADHDVFRSIEDTSGFFERRDIYNQAAKEIRPEIERPPRQKIDVGLDWKESLLTKAGWLDLYERLIQHDANQRLPFADGSFRTVFCNIAYWIENLDGLLEEFHRIATPDGQVALTVPNDSYRDYLVYRYWKRYGWEWARLLDRGRSEQCLHAYADGEWRRRFQRAGLSVAHHSMHLSPTVIRLWDIGLRPLSPPLIRMANALDPETRRSVKKEWVDALVEILTPFLGSRIPEDEGKPPAFHCYRLVRNS
jgi:SAM-dependent methyltransferase